MPLAAPIGAPGVGMLGAGHGMLVEKGRGEGAGHGAFILHSNPISQIGCDPRPLPFPSLPLPLSLMWLGSWFTQASCRTPPSHLHPPSNQTARPCPGPRAPCFWDQAGPGMFTACPSSPALVSGPPDPAPHRILSLQRAQVLCVCAVLLRHSCPVSGPFVCSADL